MKHHNCFDHLNYPHHDPPKLVFVPDRGYEEKWISTCNVCGKRYQVTREITYRFSRVVDSSLEDGVDDL